MNGNPQEELLIQRKVEQLRELIRSVPKEDDGTQPHISFDTGNDPIALEAVRRIQEEGFMEVLQRQPPGQQMSPSELQHVKERLRTLTDSQNIRKVAMRGVDRRKSKFSWTLSVLHTNVLVGASKVCRLALASFSVLN